jgi:hypothetical protein
MICDVPSNKYFSSKEMKMYSQFECVFSIVMHAIIMKKYIEDVGFGVWVLVYN